MPVHAREVSGKGAVLGVESMETIDAGGYGTAHVAAETTCASTMCKYHCHIHLVFDGANIQFFLELSAGIEPTTCSLQMSCSAN